MFGKKNTIKQAKDEIEEKISKNTTSEEENEDQDIEPSKEKERVDGSIEADDFDRLPPPPPRNEELEKAIESEEGIVVNYSYSGDDVREGLSVFQTVTTFKRNIVYTLILLVVFGVYAFNIIKTPNQTLSMFLAIMCVVVMCILWIMPKGHIKRMAAAVDQNENSFVMTVYKSCVRIGESERSFLYSYQKEITLIIETANLFMVCAGKEQIFILPKRCIEQESEEKIRNIFKEVMTKGDKSRFIDKTI